MRQMRPWREVLPLEIDQLRSVPQVASMTGAERAGFLWLVMEQWKSEDGYLPADEDFIRMASGLREEWNAAKVGIMRAFELRGRGLCYLPVREMWEQTARARDAMSSGARKANEQRREVQQPRGTRTGGGQVAGGSREAPEIPLHTQNDVRMAIYTEAKGSVIRASNGAEERAEEIVDALPPFRQLLKQGKLKAAQGDALPDQQDCGDKSGHDARNSEPAVRQARRDGGVASLAVESLAVEGLRKEFPRVQTKDELRGAGIPPSDPQERVEPASEAEEVLFGGTETDEDEIQALRQQAEAKPVARVRAVPVARLGMGVKKSW
jgi:uncharacterized protein YdaU (DUF1376 family)